MNTKLQDAIKYLSKDNKKFFTICLFIYLALISVGFFLAMTYGQSEGVSSINGFEFTLMLAIFISGISSYKNHFHFFSQMSVTRKTVVKAFVIEGFIFILEGAVFSIIFDLGLKLLYKAVPNLSDILSYHPLLNGSVNLKDYLNYFGFLIPSYSIAYFFGLMLGSINYVVGKISRIIYQMALAAYIIYMTYILSINDLVGNISPMLKHPLQKIFVQPIVNVANWATSDLRLGIVLVSVIVFLIIVQSAISLWAEVEYEK